MKKNIKRLILGIDISTTCIGLSIVSCDEDDDTKLLYISHIKPKINSKKIKGTEALFAKSRVFKEQFLNLCNHLGIQNLITDIVIEEPLPGSQNVSTVNTLLKFNGMISEAVYELTGIVPIYISSYEARKYAFPELMAVRKYNKKGEEYCYNKIKNSMKKNELVLFGNYPFDCAKKLILWNKISERYKDIQWIYNSKNELKVENFDASDSLVCILGQLGKEKYEGEVATIISYKDDKNLNNKTVRFDYEVKFGDNKYLKSIELKNK